MKREDLAALLKPLTERLHHGHHWKKFKDGPRMIDAPFTAVHLSEHAAGSAIYGLCPIAPGSTLTRVACLDLDSHKGEVPFERMTEIATTLGLWFEMDGYKPHVFRSSGGAGIHIYLLWREDQDAYSVRELLSHALEVNGFKPGTKGIAHGEIEIFPKQDEVPNDGYGSMFVLPWAGKSEPIGEFQAWKASAAVPVREREVRSLRDPAPGDAAPEYGVLKSALDAIPNSGTEELSYEEWRNIVFALHDATDGSDEGLSLAHEFSSRSSKYDGDFLDNRVWPYARSDREGTTITKRSLFAAASERGWQDPSLADDLDALPPLAEVAQPAGSTAVLPPRFTFIPERAFAIARKFEWLVKGLIPKADLVMVFGESGSGKSFWTLDLLQAIARGVEWCGRKTMKCRCAYIAAEGSAGFRNRLRAYKQENQLDETDLFVLADAPSFLDKAHVIDVCKRLKEIGPVGVVVIDTLAQVMPGGDENSSTDMGKAIFHAQMVKKHTGAIVILIHHSGKDQARGARGWSGMRGAIDTEIEIVRVGHDRVATITKQKDGSDGDEFGFKLRTVILGDDGDGGTLSSCIVEHGQAISRERRKVVVLGDKEKMLVDVLKDLAAASDEAVMTSTLLEHFKAKIYVGEGDKGRDQSGRDFTRAIQSLQLKAVIEVVGNNVMLLNAQ